jgi:hypothetical protein
MPSRNAPAATKYFFVLQKFLEPVRGTQERILNASSNLQKGNRLGLLCLRHVWR